MTHRWLRQYEWISQQEHLRKPMHGERKLTKRIWLSGLKYKLSRLKCKLSKHKWLNKLPTVRQE
jgi:hypothetical protein